MAYAWQSVEEAAVTLGVSTRTLTDAPSVDSANLTIHADPATIVVAEQQLALAQEKVRRTELALVAFQQTSQMLQKEAGRTRLSARFAWAALALCSVGVYVAVGWTATKVTQAEAEKKYLHGKLGDVATDVTQTREELAKVRDDLGEARQSAARLEGELTATKSALTDIQIRQSRAATQPTFFEALGKKLASGQD